MTTVSALPSTKAASSALPLLTLRCAPPPAAAAAVASPPKPPDDVEERAVHRLAHDVAQDRARAAHQRAGDDQHAVVEAEADARRRPAGVAVEHRHHHRHVGAADRDDQRHAEHEAEQDHQAEVHRALAVPEAEAEEHRHQPERQVQLVLADKGDRRALEQAELVLAAELAEGDDGTGEGDGADEGTQGQLDAVAARDQAALGGDGKGPGLGHRSHGDEHRSEADHAVEEGHQLGHLGHLDALGHQGADAAADEQAAEHPDHALGARLAHLPGEFDDQCAGGQDGDRHADHAEQVAADRGRRVAQALQGLDEADAGNEVQQRDEVHRHLSALPSSPPGPSCPSS
jgi:hypothetical protein